ncbi:MAG: helix-turn-helix transcriptional regulator [Clostridia bacterium]|nr:helix-turn-helix transcriptional regulator [Clostridia bacterium]
MSQASAYEKKKTQPIRVSHIEMDFVKNIYPKWYPIAQNTRLCCHYHLHEHIEIIVVDEGCISFFLNGVQYDLARDDVLFINPFEPHSAFVSNRCDRAVYHAVNLDPNLLRQIPSTKMKRILDDLVNGRSRYPRQIYDGAVSSQILICLRRIIESRTRDDELECMSQTVHLFALLDQPTPSGVENENRLSAEFIKTVVTYIQNTPLQEISLGVIASTMSYNKAYFTTLFKKNFGMSFIDYVNNYKIELAKGYIRNGNYNLNEVAMESGFNYYAYFFKKFKVITGVSPSDFAEQCRAERKS